MARAHGRNCGLATLVVAGCTDASDQSKGSSPADLKASLLTREEAISLGAPPSIEKREGSPASGDDSDPLGPCGSGLENHPPYVPDQTVLFTTIDPRPFGLIHEVWEVSRDVAVNHMADIKADTEVGCDPHEVRRGDETGAWTLIEEIETGGLGDESTAFVIEGSVEGTATIYQAHAWVRVGSTLTLILISTISPPDPELLITIAEGTSQKLKQGTTGEIIDARDAERPHI